MSPYVFAPYLYLPLPFLYLLVAAVLLWRKPVFHRRLVAITTIVFLLFSMPVVSRLMVLALVPDYGPDGTEEFEPVAVVVPTVGIFKVGASGWRVDIISLQRLDSGQRLASEYQVPLIVRGLGHGLINA